jgi:hypothetical protein
MKKTRIFLVAACTVMAVAGVFASNANQKALDHYYFIDTANENECTLVEETPPCQTEFEDVCAATGFNIYATNDAGTCTDRLGRE